MDPWPYGAVYVETDRALPTTLPSTVDDVEAWAKEPLSEIAFLRRVVEFTGNEDEDGVRGNLGDRVVGVVLYAPVHLRSELFEKYMVLAKEVAGEHLWKRVVGFRYLLQGKGEGEVGRIVGSEEWMVNLVRLGREGKVFDVGIDTNRDGEEGLREVGEMVQRVREKEREDGMDEGRRGRFVLSKSCFSWILFMRFYFEISFAYVSADNLWLTAESDHLCKPPLSKSPSPGWISALRNLSSDKNIFMKLSGAFNEFEPAPTPSSVQEIVKSLSPFLDVVFECFPERVMFGSDWPVCNVGGPKGEEGNWGFWREVVEKVVEERGMSEEEKESVWWRAGCEAYGIEM